MLYEVALEPDPGILADFDVWLEAHVARMLELPGFRSARIYADAEADKPKRVVHYELESREALERYFAEDAARMRADGIERFGNAFRATRRVLERPGAGSTCRNCGSALEGPYCHRCGQGERSRIVSLWSLLGELIGDLFETDARIWRTLVPLLRKPGFLTCAYLDGRRVAYTPPLRLYLALSVIFFLVASFGGCEINPEAASEGDAPAETETAPGTESTAREEPSTRVTILGDEDDEVVERPDREFCDTAKFDLGPLQSPTVERRLREACRRLASDEGEDLLRALVDNVPGMLFIFLPLMAVVMKFLYLGSRRYYVEHLLFLVHFHAYVFLVLTIAVLVSLTPTVLPAQDFITALVYLFALFYPWVYLFKSMRVVYGQHALVTGVKHVLLIMAYLIALLFTLILGLAWTALFG